MSSRLPIARPMGRLLSHRRLAVTICTAVTFTMFLLSVRCAPLPGDSAEDSDSLSPSTVILSAQTLGGPDGILVYQGEEIRGEIEVPSNALVGVIKDGQPYLYHPDLGDEGVSEYNSRRAVGCFLMGLSPPSKDVAQRLADKLAVGGTHQMATGVEVKRIDEARCSLTNQSARWMAIKTRSGYDGTSNAVFLPANELDIPVTVVGAIDRFTLGVFSPSSTRTVETPEHRIETYGSIVRGAPLLAAAQVTGSYNSVITGAGLALLTDHELFFRVNAVDFVYSAGEAAKSIGRSVVPFECVDLVLPEVGLGAAEITAVGLVTGDAEALRPLVLDYVKNLINSLVGCMVEAGFGFVATPPGWVAMIINELQDILSGVKWIIDVPVRGGRDVLRYPPYDVIELEKRIQPKSIGHGQIINVGDGFLLTSGAAVRGFGATMRVEYTWVPESTENCNPDDPPKLDVLLSAGGFPVDTTVTGGGESRTWVVETTTTGEEFLPETVEFTIEVSRYSGLLVPSWSTDHSPGHFVVDVTIEYTPAE